jgi:hypothetical protein
VMSRVGIVSEDADTDKEREEIQLEATACENDV